MVGKTILILDESEASRIFLSNTLSEKQFKILETSSAKEALIFAWRDLPDLILFDPVLTVDVTHRPAGVVLSLSKGLLEKHKSPTQPAGRFA